MGEFYIVIEDASEIFFVDGLGAFLIGIIAYYIVLIVLMLSKLKCRKVDKEKSMSESNNGVFQKKGDKKVNRNEKIRIFKEAFVTTVRWSKYSIICPIVPVLIVWGISCGLVHIMHWEPFKLYEDFVLVASGICVSALAVLDSRINVGSRRENKRICHFSEVMYIVLIGLYLLVYGKGLGNPVIAATINKNKDLVKWLYLLTSIIVVFQWLIVFYIEWKAKIEEVSREK